MRAHVNANGYLSVAVGDPDLAAGEFEIDHMPKGVGPFIPDPANPRMAIVAPKPEPTYAERRAAEYPTTDALVVALVEKIGEGRPEAFDALMAQRLAIKAKYPKPG